MKKLLSIALVVVLLAGIAVSGTMAYLQDSDSDVNVMTLGNVSIAQHEYERKVGADGNYVTEEIDGVASYVLKDFTQGKALLPATEVDANGQPYNYGAGNWDDTVVRMTRVGSYGSMQVFTSKNAQDKFVTVENTGKTDAYVRTLVAIEVGGADAELIGTSYHKTWTKNEIGTIAIDDVNYYVFEYVYKGGELSDGSWRHENGILPAGDTTYPNLSQVYLQAIATNEDMEKIDGNKNGMLDILVLSQAVQAEGFADAKTALDTAFGKTSEKAAEWFGGEEFKAPTAVATADELKAALAAGESVVLTEDMELKDDPITIANDAVLDLGGHTLSGIATNASASAMITVRPGATLTLSGNGVVTFGATTPDTNWGGEGQPPYPGYANNTIKCEGKLVIDGVTVKNTTAHGGASYAIDCYQGSDLIVNSGTIDGVGKCAIRMFCNSNTLSTNVTINGGTITGKRAVWVQLPGNNINNVRPVNLTINGGELICTDSTDVCVYSYSYGDSFAGTNITITGGTFNGDVVFGGGNAKTTQENVTITGGTFNGELGRYLENDGWEDIAKP